jgi:beta-lactamase regulating signal transducer with metallopeptidase domain
MITEFLTLDPRSLIETVLAVSALILLVLLARKPVAREFGAGIAYALWLVPLARLILPPLPTGMSWISLLGLAPTVSTAEVAGNSPTASTEMSLFMEASAGALARDTEGVRAVFVAPESPVDAPVGFLTGADLSSTLLTTLLGIWIVGALIVIARNAAAQHNFMAVIRRERRSPSNRLQGIADQVARQVGLKRTPQIATSLISNGPLVTGLVRPIVLLPAWFESDYDDTQQRAALAHELTHVKRGDLWALQLAELFVACLWFNPLAYLARQAFRTDQEAACDSDVLRCGAASPHAYGSTLLKAVRISVPERLPLGASLPLTHSLKERMRLMTYPAPSKRRRLAGLGLTAVLGSATLVATASISASAGEPEQDLVSNISIDNSTLFIDGEKVENRQFVLLSAPFDGVDPDGDHEIRKLSKLIEKETHKLKLPPPVPPMPEMPPVPTIPTIPAVPPVPTVMELKESDSGNRQVFVFRGNEDDAAKTAAEWEDWADEFEKATDEWKDLVDEQMANWGAEHDADSETANREIEARIEAWSRKIDARVEAVYGSRMEHHFDDVSKSIETLALSCRDTELAAGETRILRSETPNGETLHVACVEGDSSRLHAPETLATIKRSELLCDEEKQAFTSKLASKQKVEISRH